MAHISHSTPPMWIPPPASKRRSSPAGTRLSSSPLPGSSFFEPKLSSSISSATPRSYTTPSMSTSLHPPSLQRSKSTNTSPRPRTPAPPPNPHLPHATDPKPSLSRMPSMPLRAHTINLGTSSERPGLPSRSSTLPHARPSPVPYTTATVKNVENDTTRRRVRADMLQWVASEVESIEKETEAIAQRNLSTRQGMRRRGSTLVEPPTPDRLAEDTVFPPVRRVQSRRGSVDSAVAGGWRPVEIPRKAKDWEKWAENKVQTRRRLDELWKTEDDAVKETERLVQETQTQDKIRRERDARRQWDRQAFLEKERQRAVREEQERLGEQKREQHLKETLKAEAVRQANLEREVRRIEQEARRLDEELRQSERKRQAADAAARAKAQQERSRERTTPQPKATYESTWQPFDLGLDSDSDYFGAEWERFAEIFKLGASKSNTKSKYQSPAATFKDAWESYETRWSQLSKSAPHPGGDLTKATPPRFGFADIPWPVLHQPTKAADVASLMTEGSIASFILSPFHSTSGGSASSSPNVDTKTRKARLREALLRWHPDKMARILIGMTAEDERVSVKAGAEAVARHLNALLARESS